MRQPTDAAKVEALMHAIGSAARSAGKIYFTGGTSAVLFGWRETTADIDLKLDPEPLGVFEILAKLKEQLDINIELAAPDQFIPPLPDWQARSRLIGVCGEVEFYHYDFVSQALSKIERGHERDVLDVSQMLLRGLVTKEALCDGFAAIQPILLRYPAIDAGSFARKLEAFLETFG